MGLNGYQRYSVQRPIHLLSNTEAWPCLRSMFFQMTSKNLVTQKGSAPSITLWETPRGFPKFLSTTAQRVSEILKYVPLPRGFPKFLSTTAQRPQVPLGLCKYVRYVQLYTATQFYQFIFSILQEQGTIKYKPEEHMHIQKFLKDHLCSRVTIPLSSTLSPLYTTLSIK